MPQEELRTRCAVVGGGPAGIMLSLLLARSGVPVLALEKHTDFLRDFRGDTIHPSTLAVLHELGLAERFLRLPHQQVRRLGGEIGGVYAPIADFSRLRTPFPFIALMPQWDFLDFLADEGRRYPAFRLMMQAEATDLVIENGQVSGIQAHTPEGPVSIRADLVVAADGRHSAMRERAGLAVRDLGAPIDVLWMRISRRPGDPPQTMGRLDAGRLLVMIDRGAYWQCGFIIPKDGFEHIRACGLPAFRDEIAAIAPDFADRLHELREWSDVKLLTVAVNRLPLWHRPGFLCIGDAAHAMSPIGGVGINLAIQDAVAAANILAPRLRDGPVAEEVLAVVQRRRQFPTRATQGLQVFMQNRIIGRVLGTAASPRLPLLLRLLRRWPRLQGLPAKVIGIGFRPEHIRIPAA